MVVLCFCVFAGGGVFLGWLCPALGSGFGGWLVRVFVFVVCFVCVFCGVCLCGLPGWVCLAGGFVAVWVARGFGLGWVWGVFGY